MGNQTTRRDERAGSKSTTRRPAARRLRVLLPLLFGLACTPQSDAEAPADRASAVEASANVQAAPSNSAARVAPGAQDEAAIVEPGNGKRALVIAIGDYPEPNVNGYRRINSANDVPLIESALRAQDFQAIRIVRNADADRAGILNAFEQLIASAQPNDVVVVHYSGHGDQLTDSSGDEIDGYDEVLVPHGAPANDFFKNRYGAEAPARAAAYAADPNVFKHVRDDELNELLTRLRLKVGRGGNVFVSIDACHSGTGTRGQGGPMPRGPDDPIGDPAVRAQDASRIPDEAGLFEEAAAETSADLAPYVVLSASRQGEKDWETRNDDGTPVGPLSLALHRVLPGIRPGESYQALFDRVAVMMSSLVPHQVPQIEGHASTEIFSGRAVPYQPYFRVAELLEPGAAILAGGHLTGLSTGSRVAFYPIGGGPAAQGAEAVARGTVTATDASEARVSIDGGTRSSVNLLQTWAFVTEAAFGEIALGVQIDASVSRDDRAALSQALTARGLARLVDDAAAADLIVRAAEPEGSAVAVHATAGQVQLGAPIPRSREFAESVRDRVEDYARNRYLKRIEMRSPDVDVRLSLVPATHSFRESVRGRQCVSSDVDAPGRAIRQGSADRSWQLTEGDGFLLQFENLGRRPAYVAILELYPDGRIGQMYPLDQQRQAEERIAPGQTIRFDEACFSASAPFGAYMLKLFATDASARSSRPIDFRPILSGDGGQSRGELGPFERLLDSTFASTRSERQSIATDSGSTDALLLKVVPR